MCMPNILYFILFYTKGGGDLTSQKRNTGRARLDPTQDLWLTSPELRDPAERRN